MSFPNGRGDSWAWLDRTHRAGAILLGLGLWMFALLGFAEQLAFFTTDGQPVLGLSSNGLLSTISVLVGAVLIAAGVRGGRTASTVTAVIGVLFLVSGLGNLAVLDTDLNLLAFRVPNVIFSLVVGMVLLFLGTYGRVSGSLPSDNPYYRQRHPDDPRSGSVQDDETNRAATEAEIAMAAGHPTADQERQYRLEALARARDEHERAWEHYVRMDRADLYTPESRRWVTDRFAPPRREEPGSGPPPRT